MPKRFTDTDKWKKVWFRKLKPIHKCFWNYLCDNCNHAGIWEVDFELAKLYIGKNLNITEIKKIFEKQYVEICQGKKWFVKDFIDFQYGKLNPDNRVHSSIIFLLKKEGVYKGYIRGVYRCKDKDKDKDKEERIDIATLTLKSSFLNNQKKIYPMLNVEGEIRKCVSHFTAKGKKIKSWERTIANWLKIAYDKVGIVEEKVREKPKFKSPYDDLDKNLLPQKP